MGDDYMIKNKSISVLIVLSMAISFESLPVYADEEINKVNNTIVYSENNGNVSAYADIPLFDETQKLNLPKNRVSYWFTVPQGSTIDGSCYINLYLTLSNTLINERSSITLAVNDRNLETKWMKEVEKTSSGWWKVAIPVGLLSVDQPNKLEIITAQRSIEGDCADIDNPSNWVNINKESYLHIGVSKYPVPYLGNSYSYFYDDLNNKNVLSNEFIMGENQNDSDINGMLKISSAIGKEYPYKDILSYKVSNNGTSKDGFFNKIYIGNIDKWKSNKELVLPENELNSGEGFLSVFGVTSNSPYNKMLISGKDQAGVNKAVDLFSDTDYLKQIKENNFTLKSDINDKQEKFKSNESGLYNFKDFGYSTVNLAGAFHQSINFSFSQPNGLQSGNNSYIKLKFRHSNALVSDNSLLTVYFDDVAQNSVKLSPSNADGGEIKVNIPEKALKEDTIKVRIECYNYLGKIDCSKDYYDTAWTVIDEDSEIYFEPSQKGLQPNLVNLPQFNTVNADDNDKLIIGMPQKHDNNILNLANLIATRAGQNSGKAFQWKSCFSSNELADDDKDNNMIFVGSFDDIDLPSEVKKNIAVDSLGNGEFKIIDELKILPELLKNKIVVQTIRSPWNFNKKIYVVLYDKNVEGNVGAFLSDRKLLKQLESQVSIIDNEKNITNYKLNVEESQEKAPLTFEYAKYVVGKKLGISIYVLGGMIVLLIAAILLILKVRKDKFKFKNAKEKMKEINKDDIEEKDEVSELTNNKNELTRRRRRRKK